MEEIIDNDFKGDKEINEADNVCAKVDADMKNKIKKILIDINKKSTENQRKILRFYLSRQNCASLFSESKVRLNFSKIV